MSILGKGLKAKFSMKIVILYIHLCLFKPIWLLWAQKWKIWTICWKKIFHTITLIWIDAFMLQIWCKSRIEVINMTCLVYSMLFKSLFHRRKKVILLFWVNCHFKETGSASLSYCRSFCLTSAAYIISRTLFPFCRHMFRTWRLYTHTHTHTETQLSPQGPVRKQACYQVSQLRVQIKRGLVSHNCANSIQVCWSAAKIGTSELIHG